MNKVSKKNTKEIEKGEKVYATSIKLSEKEYARLLSDREKKGVSISVMLRESYFKSELEFVFSSEDTEKMILRIKSLCREIAEIFAEAQRGYGYDWVNSLDDVVQKLISLKARVAWANAKALHKLS